MLELTTLLILGIFGNGSVSNWDVQKQAYFSILHSVITASFWGSNLALLKAVESLLPSSKAFIFTLFHQMNGNQQL